MTESRIKFFLFKKKAAIFALIGAKKEKLHSRLSLTRLLGELNATQTHTRALKRLTGG